MKKPFIPRTTKPTNEPYYIRKVSGGYNGAIAGSPTDPVCNVLANCVGYANGRFGEIIGKDTIEYQLICNAENFIEVAKQYGLTISKKPTLGGIMVWQKGATLSGSDGAGHVAVVEKIIDDNNIQTSESGYGCKNPFWITNRSNNNKRWGAGEGYTFRGCIVNPAVDEDTKPIPDIPVVTKPTVPPYYLRTGSRGTDAINLQKCLNYLGYKGANGVILAEDGILGTNSIFALKNFQRNAGLVSDGIYGPQTWEKMKIQINKQ